MAHTPTIVNGKELVSVTQALGIIRKPFLEKWRGKYGNKHCDKKQEAAAHVGTAFHDAAEALVNGSEAEKTTPRVTNMVRSFCQWLNTSGFHPEVTEFKVISKKHGYAGTLDAIGKLRGSDELVLFDWKTGAGIYKDMAWQLAAYAQAYFEQTGIVIKKGVIVQVSKDKPRHKLTVKEFMLDKSTLRPFLHALALYKAVNNKG